MGYIPNSCVLFLWLLYKWNSIDFDCSAASSRFNNKTHTLRESDSTHSVDGAKKIDLPVVKKKHEITFKHEYSLAIENALHVSQRERERENISMGRATTTQTTSEFWPQVFSRQLCFRYFSVTVKTQKINTIWILSVVAYNLRFMRFRELNYIAKTLLLLEELGVDWIVVLSEQQRVVYTLLHMDVWVCAYVWEELNRTRRRNGTRMSAEKNRTI